MDQNNIEVNTSVRLALLGATITTIGDAISMIAAAKALDEAILANAKQQQEQKEQEQKEQELEQKLQTMQNQIDKLTEKMKSTAI